MAIIKLSRTERRRLSLFIVCLFIAGFSWLFFSLSNKYTYRVKTRVKYINLPRLAFKPLQPDTLDLVVEGTGWQLVFSKLHLKPSFINVDLKELNHSNYVTLSSQLAEIKKQLYSAQKLISTVPDTLYFDFSTRSFKKVPVLLAKNLQLKNQYHISGPIKLKPEYVTIAGPATVLAGIHFWKTDSLKMKNVSNNISKTVSLQPTKANISIYPHNVNVIIPVDEFTEKSIEVPVKILNNRHYEVKLLPEKVKITFLVALNNYPETNIESFKAAVDLNNWVNQKYTQLPVQLIKLPKYCKLVSVEPQTIDFILQE